MIVLENQIKMEKINPNKSKKELIKTKNNRKLNKNKKYTMSYQKNPLMNFKTSSL